MGRKLHSLEARRYVRMAQMAGLALGVSAAALLALEVPMLRYQPPAAPQVVPVAKQQDEQPYEERLDRERTEGIAVRLNQGVRKPPAPPKEQPRTVEDPQPKALTGPSIVYIGSILEPDRRIAVIAVDGKQQLVREGRKVGESQLVSIADHEIVLQESGGERRAIARGERTERVSWVRNMPGTAPIAGAVMGQNAARRGVAVARAPGSPAFSPELEQRLRERGIDPEQAQRWREAMREREAQRGGEIQGIATSVTTRTLSDRADEKNADYEVITETIDGDDYIIRMKRLQEEGLIGEDGEMLP
jgi:hypothetical protein